MLDNNGTLGIGQQEVPVVIPTDEELQQYLYGDEEPIAVNPVAGQVNPAAVAELISSNGNAAGDGDEFDDDDDLLLEGEADDR